MQVLEQTEIKLEWKDSLRLYEHPYPTYKRSKGIHVTDVLRYIAIKTNLLTDEDRNDDMPLRVFLGMAWEQMCVRLYDPNEIKWQPGELERDGIMGSPDGFSMDWHPTIDIPTDMCIEEFKYTAKSLRKKGGEPDQLKDITREWLWMNQVMAYCNMAGLNMARLHVCWACGNYVYPLTERYVRYLIRFEPRELEGNWKMITKYAKGMRYGTE